VAAKPATTTIPIIFSIGADPIALGLVASLNRPGANLTGIAILAAELAPKRLQLVRELTPNAALFGVLADPTFPATQSTIADLQAAALTLGVQLIVVNASDDSDLETAFATFLQQRVGAVLVSDSRFYGSRTEQLAALAARHALPAIFPFREYALAAGLMSYGSSQGYGNHQAGLYTGRILKGEKGHQSQNSQSARPHHPGNAVGHRRRGDSVRGRQLGSAAAWPVAVGAQQPSRMRRIGVLMNFKLHRR
jgi:putative ABC transport system substrate-binding protein